MALLSTIPARESANGIYSRRCNIQHKVARRVDSRSRQLFEPVRFVGGKERQLYHTATTAANSVVADRARAAVVVPQASGWRRGGAKVAYGAEHAIKIVLAKDVS